MVSFTLLHLVIELRFKLQHTIFPRAHTPGRLLKCLFDEKVIKQQLSAVENGDPVKLNCGYAPILKMIIFAFRYIPVKPEYREANTSMLNVSHSIPSIVSAEPRPPA